MFFQLFKKSSFCVHCFPTGVKSQTLAAGFYPKFHLAILVAESDQPLTSKKKKTQPVEVSTLIF